MGEMPLQQMGVGELGIHMQKIEVRLLPYTIYRNQLKMDYRPKHNT